MTRLPLRDDDGELVGPRAVLVTIRGCGHAPALNGADQLALVDRFISADH